MRVRASYSYLIRLYLLPQPVRRRPPRRPRGARAASYVLRHTLRPRWRLPPRRTVTRRQPPDTAGRTRGRPGVHGSAPTGARSAAHCASSPSSPDASAFWAVFSGSEGCRRAACGSCASTRCVALERHCATASRSPALLGSATCHATAAERLARAQIIFGCIMIGGEVPIMYLVNHCRFLYTYEGKGFFLIFVSTCVDHCLPYDHPASDWNPD